MAACIALQQSDTLNHSKMKIDSFKILMVVFYTLILSAIGWSQTTTSLGVSGPYLGQTPPGKQAVLFADGMISKLDEPEMCAAFSMDGKEFYFNAKHENSFSIFITKEVDGKWSIPEPLPFSDSFTDRDFTISSDGNRIYFGSNRPALKGGEKLKGLDIYFIERDEKSGLWSEPKNIGYPVNTDNGENYPCIVANGNLYYFSCRQDEGLGGCDIFRANFVDGKYESTTFMGPAINSEKHDWDAYVAPDESYLIFSSLAREDTHGTMDLYISFRNAKGEWTKAKNMGLAMNSAYDEICPSVTLDGKYLFFTSRRRGEADIFWVDAKVIEELK